MTEIPDSTAPARTTPIMHPVTPDWGRGHYERTAKALAAAAEAVVRAGKPRPGERVLDIGCGTGSVALIAARAGARVTGVNPAPRLLAVARDLARDERLEVDFLHGYAGSLPLTEASVDVALSNFGLIFAPDPPAAVAEMVRVLEHGGRVAFSAWLPGGTIGAMNAAAMKLVRDAVGAPAPPPAFAWHEHEELTGLFGGYDTNLSSEQHGSPSPPRRQQSSSTSSVEPTHCVKNGGKSPMAANIMRMVAGGAIAVDSAGTKPGHQTRRHRRRTVRAGGARGRSGHHRQGPEVHRCFDGARRRPGRHHRPRRESRPDPRHPLRGM